MQPFAARRVERAFAARIIVTLLLCGAALAASLLLRDQIAKTIFVFFWAALIITAWYAGFGAALFVMVFAVLSVKFFILEPRGSFELDSLGNLISLAIFTVLALIVSWLGQRMRSAEKRALEHAHQLEENALELETQMEANQSLTDELARTLQDSEAARAEAETANKAKSEFLAVMSHELRTPLNAIVGYTDLLDSQVAGPLNQTQLKHLSRIRSSSWHLLELIQDVLSFSRMEAGRETKRIANVEAAALAKEVLAYVRPDAQEKELRLETELPAESIDLITDPGKLRQILLNLLTNAVKFTDSGTVGLRLHRNGEGVEFQVWDTGHGIDGAHQELIFEPFTQVDQSTTREKGGVGLGLPVSKRLAELLGGSLTLTSRPGEGSTFFLRLPIKTS